MHEPWAALLVLAIVLAIFGSAAWASIRGAPWLPTLQADSIQALHLAGLKTGEVFYDLGCGDGRVCIVAAEQFGARAIGCELSLLPFCIAHLRRLASPARARISIRLGDYLKQPLAGADVVFIFSIPHAMGRLKTKFVQECRPTTRIVSSTFSIPGWQEQGRAQRGPKSPLQRLYIIPARDTD